MYTFSLPSSVPGSPRKDLDEAKDMRDTNLYSLRTPPPKSDAQTQTAKSQLVIYFSSVQFIGSVL